MGNLSKRQRLVSIGLLLLTFVLVLSLSLSAIAQECKGPNLNLTVFDMKGEVINLNCAYYGYDTWDSITCLTDGGIYVDIKLHRIRKISIVRDQEGRVILPPGAPVSYILAVVELKDGDSRKIFIRENTIVGYNSWGKHTLALRNIQTVQFE